MPGSNAAMLSTAFVFKPDSVMFDLEDAVSLRKKDAARLLTFHALQSRPYDGIETVVRINLLTPPFGMADLEAVVRLPKTDSAEDVLPPRNPKSSGSSAPTGREIGSTQLIDGGDESASGVINAVSIATSSKRLIGIALTTFD